MNCTALRGPRRIANSDSWGLGRHELFFVHELTALPSLMMFFAPRKTSEMRVPRNSLSDKGARNHANSVCNSRRHRRQFMSPPSPPDQRTPKNLRFSEDPCASGSAAKSKDPFITVVILPFKGILRLRCVAPDAQNDRK